MATLSEARKSHGSHSAGLDLVKQIQLLLRVIRKLAGGGKHTGSVYDQTGKLPSQTTPVSYRQYSLLGRNFRAEDG